MNANAFVHWGLSLASDILEICKEGKAAAIVDAIKQLVSRAPISRNRKTGPPEHRSGGFFVSNGADWVNNHAHKG